MSHDAGYKLLFSHAEMVADLLRGFLPPEWVEQLDIASLEKVSGSYVSDDLRDRHNDVVWRLRWGPRWLYVYILLEMQSSVDRFMAVRLMTYIGLLYQDLIKAKQLSDTGKVPAVLPVVLYNGGKRWQAATTLGETAEAPPPGLEPFQPDLRFLLLDEGRYRSEELLAWERNLAEPYQRG